MASLRKLTELSPLFLRTGGGSITVGEGWRIGLGTVSSGLVGFWWTERYVEKVKHFQHILMNRSHRAFIILITHRVFPDLLHAISRHRCRGVQAQRGDSVLVQGNVEPAISIETRGEDLRAVAPHAARPPLPGCYRWVGATPEGVPMNAVLVVSVSLRVDACPERAEDADLASSSGAKGVRRERGQQGVDWQRRWGRL